MIQIIIYLLSMHKAAIKLINIYRNTKIQNIISPQVVNEM